MVYEGTFSKGLYGGAGTLYFPAPAEDTQKAAHTTEHVNSKQYIGSFKQGLFHGKGISFYEVCFPDRKHPSYKGVHYEGKYRYDQYSGYGALYGVSGEVIHKGYFLGSQAMVYKGPVDPSGKMHGKGTLKTKDGKLVYDGNFIHGAFHGEGTFIDPESNLNYVGSFKNDEFNGLGKIFNNNVLYYKGSFKVGLMSGKGILYNSKGEVLYSGQFEGNKPVIRPY